MKVKIREFTISSPEWGDVLIMRPVRYSEDPWGDFACLQGTIWGDNIPVIDGDIFSQALHRRVTPLMNVIGPEPRRILMKIRGAGAPQCRQWGSCVAAHAACVPGKRMPECYVPDGFDSFKDARAAAIVALAWSRDRYVVVVEGQEYSYA